jgi:hypothetical protein
MMAMASMKKPKKTKKRITKVMKKAGLVEIDCRKVPHACGIWALVKSHAQILAVAIRMKIMELVMAVFKIDVMMLEKVSFLVTRIPTIKT